MAIGCVSVVESVTNDLQFESRQSVIFIDPNRLYLLIEKMDEEVRNGISYVAVLWGGLPTYLPTYLPS